MTRLIDVIDLKRIVDAYFDDFLTFWLLDDM